MRTFYFQRILEDGEFAFIVVADFHGSLFYDDGADEGGEEDSSVLFRFFCLRLAPDGVEEEADFIFRERAAGVEEFFALEAVCEGPDASFCFLDMICQALAHEALFDSFNAVFHLFSVFGDFGFQGGDGCALFLAGLELHGLPGDEVNDSRGVKKAGGSIHYHVIHQVRADRTGGAVFLQVFGAAVVVIDAAASGSSRFPVHPCAAESAEDLSGKAVEFGGPDDVLLSAFVDVLGEAEGFFVDEGGDGVFFLYAAPGVGAGVELILQEHIKAAGSEFLPAPSKKGSLIQCFGDLLFHDAVGEGVENELYYRSRLFVDDEMMGRIQLVPKRHHAAGPFSFQHVFRHASLHIFCQFCRIIFSHAFDDRLKEDAGRIVGDVFHGRNHLHAEFFKLVLILCAVVAVPGKAVQLVNDDIGKSPGGSVVDHELELGPLVRPPGHGAVGVCAEDLVAVPPCEIFADADLAFDGFLSLAV